jgi:hypothetical protein
MNPAPVASEAAPEPAPEATASGGAYEPFDPAQLSDASTIAEVHRALIRPGYDRLTAAESDAPTDEAGWKALSEGTDMIEKGLTLLTTGGRPKGDKADFIKLANAARDKIKPVRELIGQKTTDELVFKDGDLQEACTACHSRYRQ